MEDDVKKIMKDKFNLDFDNQSEESEEMEENETEEVLSPTGALKLINILYKAKEDTHLAHNVQRTRDASVHGALGDLYTAMDGMIDSFVEAVFGIYGPGDITFTAAAYPLPVEYLKKLYATIEKERKFFKESWIQNDIDNFQKEIALTLYKLQYVKSEPNV